MRFKNFSFLIFCFLILPSLVSSADFVSMVGIPGIPDNGTDLNQYFNAIYRLSISLAALLAVVKIVMAGAKYMLTDIVPAKGEALDDIKGALLGLLVILAAVLILGTINKNILNTDLTFEKVATDSQPATPQDPSVPSNEFESVCKNLGYYINGEYKCTMTECSYFQDTDNILEWIDPYETGILSFIGNIIDYSINSIGCNAICGFREGEVINELFNAGSLDTLSGQCVWPKDFANALADTKETILREYGNLCTGPVGCEPQVCSSAFNDNDCRNWCENSSDTDDLSVYIPEYRGCLIPIPIM